MTGPELRAGDTPEARSRSGPQLGTGAEREAESSDPRDDAALLRAAQSGEVHAWAVLCHRSVPELAAYLAGRIGRPEVIERLVAQAIAVGWRQLGEVSDPARFTAWFRRLGGSLALAWRHEHPNESLTGDFPAERCRDAADAKQQQHLHLSLAALSEPSRRMLEAVARSTLTEVQIAEMLHLVPGSFGSALDAALDELDRVFAAQGQALPSRGST